MKCSKKLNQRDMKKVSGFQRLGGRNWDCPLRVMSFPGSSAVKNLFAMQEMRVQSLGWEHPLEKDVATHSSILAWRTPWTEEPVGLQFIGSQRVRHNCSNWACMHANGHEVSFWDDWNVLELDIVMFTQSCEYAKSH